MSTARLSFARLLIAVLCFTSWTVAANQCALGLIPMGVASDQRDECRSLRCDCGTSPHNDGPSSASCVLRCSQLRAAVAASSTAPTKANNATCIPPPTFNHRPLPVIASFDERPSDRRIVESDLTKSYPAHGPPARFLFA
jgi:hypothetical protein